MLIECPFCHARARLSDDKEGAKVRCGSCGKVYRARESSAAGHRPRPRKKNWSGLVIAIGTVAVLGILALIAMRAGGREPAPVKAAVAPPEPEPAPVEEPVDTDGWGSSVVQAAVRAHSLAAEGNTDALEDHLFGPLLAHREDPPAAPTDDVDALEAAWRELRLEERDARLAAAVASLTDASDAGTVAGWTPYDGELESRDFDLAVVHLSATPASGGTTKRVVEWFLARRDGEWKPWAWREWMSDTERRKAERGYDVVRLSDGAVVVEREPEPLGHLEDTPPELRERLDELVATMLDLSLTTQASRASREVVEIGRPAIPLLLTHLYENKLYDVEDSKRANIAVVALREITGQFFGYQPQSLATGSLGTTEERRQSAIRQWFAWWYRNADTFTGPETADATEPEEE